jgi:hypothetical protein
VIRDPWVVPMTDICKNIFFSAIGNKLILQIEYHATLSRKHKRALENKPLQASPPHYFAYRK